MQLIFLMAMNRSAYFMDYELVDKFFKKSRIRILVSICTTLSAMASSLLIYTSEMKRFYVPKASFVDTGSPGYQMLINRLFYIFPFGSIGCYVMLYFYIRKMANRAISSRAVKNGEQKIFIQLLITACFYSTMCILFEIINAFEWKENTSDKIDLVSILNIINYLPEISLPLMLLLSNTDMRRRVSTLMVARGSQSRTVSVIPVT